MMGTELPNGLQLRSLVTADAKLQLSLVNVPTPPPSDDDIVVRVEAAPINPSDLGLLIGAADIANASTAGSGRDTLVTASIDASFMRAMAARVGESMPVGNEGAGTVIAAGASAQAQALVGKRVAMIGGAMYSQYRTLRAADVMVLPDGISAAEGASCFVNPLTALGMVETMRREGHSALVHTAAASNLGQMLQKICLKDGVPLVNIVRSPAQAAILHEIGATYVCDSSAPEFMADLTDALAATSATMAFDAIGGGKLAGQILTCMEAAINRNAKEYSRYGSSVHKQVYIYGGLDMSPTVLNRSFGMIWSVGGWLLTPFLQKIGRDAGMALRARVLAELTTTFASHYSDVISLSDALRPDVIARYNRRATGEKYLIDPSLD